MKRLLTVFIISLLATSAYAERLKDLAMIAGARTNQLIGYGLVVGLDGTGDQTTQTEFTIQSFRSMLSQLGITMPTGASMQLKNVAAVMVTAELAPFIKKGQTIDVTVSSMGNAKSLRGGTLLMTPLKGIDGKVYAVAQGNLVVGGFGGSGADGSKITVNIPSAGRIPSGATVERSVTAPLNMGNYIIYNLHTPDFTTAKHVAEAINEFAGAGTAYTLDAATIQISAPSDPSHRVSFVSMVENLTVEPGESAAKVVVNSRTGTIVIGSHVIVKPAAVAHGSLTVTISENTTVSQPNEFASGKTAVVDNSSVQVTQENNRMFLLDSGTKLKDIVHAINMVGAAPGDLMAILEALKQVGALRAELVVI